MTGVKSKRNRSDLSIQSGFSPDAVSGLYLWLAADSITGLADNDPIATWPDLSSAGDDATQATEANKPLYKTNILNGLPVVRFDSTDNLASAAAGDQKPFAHFAVVNPSSFANYQPVVGASANGGINWRFNQTTGYLNLDAQAASVIGTATSGHTAGNWVYVGVTYDGSGNWVLYLNGSVVGSGLNNQSFTATTTVIGGGSFNFIGDMAEILFYDHVLSADDRGEVFAYFQDKYGL